MARDYEVKATFSADDANFTESIKSILNGLDDVMQKAEVVGSGLESTMRAAGANMMKAGGVMTAGITAPIVALGKESADSALEFGTQMNRVAAIAGTTASDTDQAFMAMKNQAKDLGATTVFTAEQVAQGQEMMASAGFEVNEIIGAMPGVMDLAAVAGGDLSLASESVANSLRQFGLEADDSTHVADVMATVMSNSATQMEDLSQAMKYAGPIANATGQDIEGTAAAIGLMANTGIKGSQAGTALRSSLTRMAAPTAEAQRWMTKLGISFSDSKGEMKPLGEIIQDLSKKTANLSEEEKTAAFKAMFGQEAMAGMLGVVEQGPEAFKKLEDQLRNSNGAAEGMADTMMTGLPGAMAKMNSAIDGAKIAFGEALAPSIEEVAGVIEDLVTRFNELEPEQQQQIAKWLAIAAAAGPVLIVMGALTKALSPLAGALGKGAGKIAEFTGKLAPTHKGLKRAGSAAKYSGGQFAGMGVALAGAGAGLFLSAKGVKELAGAAIQLKDAGPGAVAITFGLGAGITLMAKAMAKIGPQLTAGAAGMVAFGAGLALAAEGEKTLAESSIKLADAGGKAIGTFVLMNGAIAGLAAVFSALGPALTAGAVGMVAFGGAIALAGKGVERFADASIKLAEGGKPAAKALGLLTAQTAALAGEFALLGPVLTVGSLGMVAFGKSIKDTAEGMETFVDASIKLNDAGEGATETFEKMLEAVGNLAGQVKDLGLKFTISSLGLDQFGEGLKATGEGMEGFVDASIKLNEAGEGATETFEKMLESVGSLAEHFEDMGLKFTFASGGMESFGGMIKDASESMDGFVGNAVKLNEAGEGAVETFQLMTGEVGKLVEQFSEMGLGTRVASKGIQSIGEALKNISGGMKGFAESAVTLSQGGDQARASLSLLTDETIRLINRLDSLENTSGRSRKAVLTMGETLQNVGGAMNQMAEATKTMNEVGDNAGPILDLMGGAVEGLGQKFVELLPDLKGSSREMQAFGSMVKDAGSGSKEAAEGVAILSDKLPTLTEYGHEGAENIRILGQAMEDFSTHAEGAGPNITNFQMSIDGLNTMTQGLAESFTGLSDQITGMGEAIGGIGEQISQANENLNTLKTGLTSLHDGLIQTKTGLTALGAELQGFGTYTNLVVESTAQAKEAFVSLTAEFNHLGGSTASASSSFGGMNGAIQALKVSIKGAQEQTAVLTTTFAHVGTGAQKATSQVTGLSNKLITTGRNAGNLQARSASLSGALGNLASQSRVVSVAMRGMSTALNQAGTNTRQAMNNILQSMRSTIGPARSAGQQIGRALYQGMSPGLKQSVNRSKQSGEQIVRGLVSRISPAGNAGRRTGQAYSNGLTQQLNRANRQARAISRQVPGILNSSRNGAYNAGANIGISFANGMASALGRVRSIASQLAAQADRAIRAKARIGSPSKVQIKNGEDWAGGFVLGMQNRMADVRRTAKEIGSIDATGPKYSLSGYGRPGVVPQEANATGSHSGGSNGPTEIIFKMGETTYRAQVNDFTEKQRQIVDLAERYV